MVESGLNKGQSLASPGATVIARHSVTNLVGASQKRLEVDFFSPLWALDPLKHGGVRQRQSS